jgi:hypothetical protein
MPNLVDRLHVGCDFIAVCRFLANGCQLFVEVEANSCGSGNKASPG